MSVIVDTGTLAAAVHHPVVCQLLAVAVPLRAAASRPTAPQEVAQTAAKSFQARQLRVACQQIARPVAAIAGWHGAGVLLVELKKTRLLAE